METEQWKQLIETKAYNTTHTNRIYKITVYPPNLYAGIYELPTTITGYHNKFCKLLDIDPESTDYHPDGLDFDASELAAYATHLLVTENKDIQHIERIK